jgi:hypothetical protein
MEASFCTYHKQFERQKKRRSQEHIFHQKKSNEKKMLIMWKSKVEKGPERKFKRKNRLVTR